MKFLVGHMFPSTWSVRRGKVVNTKTPGLGSFIRSSGRLPRLGKENHGERTHSPASWPLIGLHWHFIINTRQCRRFCKLPTDNKTTATNLFDHESDGGVGGVENGISDLRCYSHPPHLPLLFIYIFADSESIRRRRRDDNPESGRRMNGMLTRRALSPLHQKNECRRGPLPTTLGKSHFHTPAPSPRPRLWRLFGDKVHILQLRGGR